MISNKLAIASISLGQHESHTLPDKIAAAAHAGLSGIEIVYSDLDSYAQSLSISMLDAAQKIKTLCGEKNVTIISLAALENFEGTLTPLDDRLAKAKKWLGVVRALDAEFLQVPSTYDRKITQDPGIIISELQQLSDLAASSKPVIKIAYENLAWSSHCSLWQEALEIVNKVDRENFGLCLDSFHFTTKLWADPHNETGVQPDGDEKLDQSLQELVRDCPMNKIFYVQLSDGERLSPPYSKDHPWYNPELEVGHVWSMEARPFPLEFECGAYMPVDRFAKAFLVDKGFSGWVSLETFDRRMRARENGPIQSVNRAMKAWRELEKALNQGIQMPRL